MNVALPAIVLFFILLPGFAFRTLFKRIERTSLDYSPFGQVVTEAVGWAALLHGLWLTLAYVFLGQRVQTDVLIGLLGSDASAAAAAVRQVRASDAWVATYFGSLYAASIFGGYAARALISHFRLDRSDRRFARLFRFGQAPWYYLLTAAELPDSEQPDLIVASAVVEIGKVPYLYTGVVEHYYFGDDGQLDRLVLSDASRRPLSADKEFPEQGRAERFYAIDGNFFVLRYSEAVTLNIQYVRLEKLAPELA